MIITRQMGVILVDKAFAAIDAGLRSQLSGADREAAVDALVQMSEEKTEAKSAEWRKALAEARAKAGEGEA